MAEKLYRDEAWLREQYIINKKSFDEIAKEQGVAQKCIWKWIHRYNIPVRPMGSHRVGKHLSEETRLKISQSNKGKRRSPEFCALISSMKMGKPNPSAALPKSPEHCANISNAKLGKKIKPCSPERRAKIIAHNRHAGQPKESHWNWKGGITPERNQMYYSKEYQTWRSGVFERDGYKCVKCGNGKSGVFRAHHVYNFSEFEHLRTNIDNGITFCYKCHEAFHVTFGYTHNNLNQIIDFLLFY